MNAFITIFSAIVLLVALPLNVVGQDDGENEAELGNEIRELLAMENYLHHVRVCYQRFLRCSANLNAAFCSDTRANLSFFIWARKLANKILYSPGHLCSAEMMKIFYKYETTRRLEMEK